MKLNEVKKSTAISDSDYPILYHMICNWLTKERTVKFNSAGIVGLIISLEPLYSEKFEPVHGQIPICNMLYNPYTTTAKSRLVPVLSARIECTYLYPAGLEDATVEHLDDVIMINIPDYLNNPHLLKDRK